MPIIRLFKLLQVPFLKLWIPSTDIYVGFSSPLSLQLFACFIAYVWTRVGIYCPFLPRSRSSHYQLQQAMRATHVILLSLSLSAPCLATPQLSLHRIDCKHVTSNFAFPIVIMLQLMFNVSVISQSWYKHSVIIFILSYCTNVILGLLLGHTDKLLLILVVMH